MDPNTYILGTLGGHFGTFGLILVTRPLELEEVSHKFLMDIGFLLALICFAIFEVLWDQSGRLGFGPLFLVFSVWTSNPRAEAVCV